MKFRGVPEWTLKFAILIASIFYAVYKLYFSSDISQILTDFPLMVHENALWLIFVCCLMPVNWMIEAVKWKFVLKKDCRISFMRAFFSVLSGVTVGLFTPNRIGEFGGRILYLPVTKRAKGAVLSMISSYSQFFTTLLFGLPALLIFISINKEVSLEIDLGVFLIAVSLACLMMLFYFKLDLIYRMISKISFLKKYLDAMEPLKDTDRKKLLVLLGLSVLRYSVFVSQFYFMCRFFTLDLSYWQVLLCAANLYFSMSILPMFTIGEPGLRAGLTAIFFGVFTLQIASVISASILLWLVNVLFASISGAIILQTQKLFNYENKTSS